MSNWSSTKSERLYNVPQWGGGYFRIAADGNVIALPDGGARVDEPPPDGGIDLHDLVGQLKRRGVELPILLRFDGILRARVRELWAAFDRAREEYEYEAPFRGVFPIKVNQQRHVVEAMLEEGREQDMGLEVGSKPELLAVLALLATRKALVICNGYKDRDYIETALLASKLGLEPVVVIEKLSEIDTILDASDRLGIRPRIGVRSRLSSVGSGRWKDSAGDRSKFGLTTRQIVIVVERLAERDMLDCLVLLHFHIGSQITNIRSVKTALHEATRLFTGLREMGAAMEYFDVGGGLGIDYDGSSTNFDSSVNYSIQEYANDVVYIIGEACREAEIEPPTIVSESGRALTAHHAVLVTEVLGVSDFSSVGIPSEALEDEPPVIHEFAEVCAAVSAKNYQESYHDAIALREQGLTLFNVGQLSLPDRARLEEFYWRTCEKILRITRQLDYVPDDLAGLERQMADTYFLNFSLFQSCPDSWAIGQLFPVMPIHRLNEQPTRRAILADITCDSDGKIDRFIDLRDVKRTLELHAHVPGEPYLMGLFLIGAYQEILGDIHNLFGDTNAVHVDLDENRRVQIKHVVRGDRVQDVLGYVAYDERNLLAQLRRSIESAIGEDRLTFEESALLLKRYEQGLAGYTYLRNEP
ncbi:Biosynthetic arginine decarboxylase [Planctomycetes bacterium Pla86]|uniref:Biosynthetic arginine decarboxylase n=2 Tax=Engelhardtia mirabilis TaxID=2528011 RepID=A0A518BR53_9BACT|nr:Biosynthetic arginine decarboxylase [Planctomycetes bacterium Pla133]QDV03778.1 Biosynthetic arginine decarboxylase [Planctomycetes bacterium Pla86]